MNSRTRFGARLATIAGLVAVLLVTCGMMLMPGTAQALSTTLVISQVYGGGNNTGAPYQRDFIEIHNIGTAPVTMTNWSVQYAASTGVNWSKTDISGTIPPGGYFLVAESGGTTNGVPLPTPDVTGGIAMSATAGKVALVSNNTLITAGTSCPTGASIVDIVGFGSATNCSETAPTANLSNTTAAIRKTNGCTETDNNLSDFSVAAPTPRNSASTAYSCAVTYTLTTAVSPTSSGTVTLNPAGGTYASGMVVTMTANPAAHYHFVNWTGSVTGSVSPTTVTMDANKSVTANFALDTYTLTYTAGTGGAISGTSPQTVAYGGSGTQVTAVPAQHYHFVKWSDDVMTASRTETNVTADVTVEAQFALDQHVLTVLASPTAGGTVTGGGTYDYGTSVTVTATAAEHYDFVNWTGDVADPNNASTTVTVDGDKTVTANFALEQHTLTTGVDPVGGGTVTGGGTYDYGTVVTLGATANPGFSFDFWTGAWPDTVWSTPVDLTMDGDKTVIAHFTPVYTLAMVIDIVGGGTVTLDPPGGTYDAGTVVTLTAAPALHHHFVEWSGDLTGSANPTTLTMDGNKTVTANFALDTYTLGVAVTGSGTVAKDPDQASYVYGALVELTPTAALGWHFVSWGGDATGSDNPLTVTMNGNKAITALFEEDVALLVTNTTRGLSYATIKQAIDASTTLDGDQISIAAGVFEEQVVVNKALTITGAGCGSTIVRSPATLTESFVTPGPNTNKPIVFVNGVNATIQNLTIDGAGLGNANARFVGLAFWNGGGKGANLCIEHVEDTPFSGAQHGVGVYAYNETGGPYAIELDYVAVTDFQKTAIALMGEGLTANIHDCTTTGKGYTGVTAQNGIQLSDGATGAITACKVSDIGYTGLGWAASGLLISDAPGTVTVSNMKGANKIDNAQVPVYWINASGTIDGIEVTRGADWGAVYAVNMNASLAAARAGDPPAGKVRPAQAVPFDEGLTSNATTGTLATAYTLSVMNSCLYGSDAAGTSGIQADSYGGAMDVTATGNTLVDWDWGLSIYYAPATLTAHENSVTSSVTAGYDASANPGQNAERNWWGDATGPAGAGDDVMGADYDPWIHSGTNLASCAFDPPTYDIVASAGTGGSISPAGTTTAYEGDDVTYAITPDAGYSVVGLLVDGSPVAAATSYTFTNVTAAHTIAASFAVLAVQNTNTGEYFATIQAAIDDAETLGGHTIVVGTGTFEEQVVVTKALTITGAGCGATVIRSPATLTQSFTTPGPNTNKPVVFVNGVDATIQNLTIDGAGLGNSNYRFVGLAFWNGGGKGADLCIEHIEDTPFSGAQHGVGVYAYNETGGPYAIELDHVTVTDYQKTGIALLGAGLTVNVHDCTTTGKGYTAVTAQNGIQVSDGATGAITACKVTDMGYTGPDWAASGLAILDAAGTVTVSNMKGANKIDNVQAPINWYNTSGTVDGVEIANSAKGEWECGIFAYNSNASALAATVGAAASRQPPAKASPIDGEVGSNATTGTLATSYTLDVTNACVYGTDATNTVGLGVYSDGGGMVLNVANSTVTDWEYGVVHYGGPATLTAHENSITSNISAGLWGDGATTTNAERNWWGDATGPSGAGSGSGDAAYDADYDPWIHSGTDLASGCEFDPPTYDIVASAGTGGSIAPAGTTTAYEGDDVTYTVTPDVGYVISQVLADGSPVTLTGGTYTFTNVTAAHTIAASFVVAGNNTVAAVGDTVCITPVNPCLTIPVNIERTDATQMRLFHVDFTLSPELTLCGPVGSNVLEGTYLNSFNSNTTFFVLDNGGGSYTADGTINGLPCGQTAASGTLFNIKVASATGGTGTGTITIDDVVLRDCVNNDITPATPGAPAVVYFDATPVTIAEIADQTVAELASLTVTPSATITACANGPATWSISPAVPAGATFNSTDGVITWTPDCSQAGTYGPFTLTATAASGETDTEQFSILVTDTPGIVTVGVTPDPQTVVEQATLTVTPTIDLTGCAAGMTPVWSILPALPSGATFDTGTGQIVWTPACGEAGTYGPYTLTATVTAVGGQVYSGSATFGITVTHKVGTVAIDAIADQTIEELAALTVTPNAVLTDCAAAPVTWSISPALPSGAMFDTGSGQIVWTPACGEAGSYGPYTLTATAATGEVDTEEFSITVTHKVGTVTIAEVPDQTIEELSTLTVTPSASVTECASSTMTWSVSPALPGGATFDTGTGQVVWTPDCGTASTYGPYTLTATSATGETDTEQFSITVTHKVGTVSIAAIATPQTVVEQSTLTITPVPTVTPCVGTLTWTLTTGTLPAGASLDPLTGVITWTPGYGTAGTYGPFVLTATASTGEVGVSNAFSILVTHLAGTIDIAYIPTPQTVEEQGTLTITPTATVSPSVGPLTWSVTTGTLPSGASFDPATGEIVWTPPCGAEGTYGPFALTATATTGESDVSNEFYIEVTHKVGTVAVAAIATPQTVAEMATLTLTPSATLTDCAAAPLTWSVTTGTLPAWASFVAGTGVVTFSPGCTDAGSYGPFALTATAATGESGASNEFSITVTDVPVAIAAPTTVTAAQVRTGNAAGDTTGIKVYFTPPAGVVSYKIYRAPFGYYPEYDDAGGTVPTAPTTYPPPAPWVETSVTTEGGTDVPPARDFWYYVVYAVNACGDISAPSNMTAGTLDYHLGDVTNGFVHGLGDNLVQDEDISELGAHYGITLTHVGDTYNYLDVGPTTTHYVDGRPLTDDKVNFEDLVMFAINYSLVSATTELPQVAAVATTPAAVDALVLHSPDVVKVGDLVTVPLRMQGTGLVKAVSTRLSWDATVVEPVGQAAGELLQLHGVALSPEPGTVDVAALGMGLGIAGDGTLATVTFRVIANGDPAIRIESVDARDTQNEKITLNATREALAPALPTVTALSFAQPNPFRSEVTLSFSLAQGGPASLRIYSVDGRLVRTLVSGTQEAGYYRPVWDGRDDHGNAMSAGVFYARLVAGKVHVTRTMSYLR